MEKKLLGTTEIYVSPVGMGTSALGPGGRARSLADGATLVRYAIGRGIDFLYAPESVICLRYIRKALHDLEPSFSQNALPRPVIAVSSLAISREETRRALDDCRSALNLDVIDVFLLRDVVGPQDHGIDAPHSLERRADVWECLLDAKSKGLIRAAGITTHDPEAMAAAANTPGMDVVFPHLNFMSLGTDSREKMEAAVIKASENGVGAVATGVLGGGSLLSEYMSALNYAANLKGLSGFILGMGCKKDVDDATAFVEGRLPETYVPEPSIMKMFIDHSLCTGCGECVKYCTDAAINFADGPLPVVDTDKCVRCGFCLPVCQTRALLFL